MHIERLASQRAPRRWRFFSWYWSGTWSLCRAESEALARTATATPHVQLVEKPTPLLEFTTPYGSFNPIPNCGDARGRHLEKLNRKRAAEG